MGSKTNQVGKCGLTDSKTEPRRPLLRVERRRRSGMGWKRAGSTGTSLAPGPAGPDVRVRNLAAAYRGARVVRDHLATERQTALRLRANCLFPKPDAPSGCVPQAEHRVDFRVVLQRSFILAVLGDPRTTILRRRFLMWMRKRRWSRVIRGNAPCAPIRPELAVLLHCR